MTIICSSAKAVKYDERQIMMRGTRQKKQSSSLEKNAFLLGISLHFRSFVERYGFESLN